MCLLAHQISILSKRKIAFQKNAFKIAWGDSTGYAMLEAGEPAEVQLEVSSCDRDC